MQPAIGSALRTALNPIARNSCRFVGATRHPLSRRAFHRSATAYGIGEDEGVGGSKRFEGDGTKAKDAKEHEIGSVEEDVTSKGSSPVADPAAAVATPAMLGGRTNRQRNNGLPVMNIPNRFLNENVKLVENPSRSGSLTVCGKQADMDIAKDLCVVPIVEDAKYSINVNIYREVLATLKAELTFRPPPSVEKSIARPVTVLFCPKSEGTFYLNSVVETAAEGLGADVVRLDAQDIAQIVGDYVGENLAWTASETSHLGYRANKAAGRMAKDEDFETDFEADGGALDDSVSSMFNEIMGRGKGDGEHTNERRPGGRMPRLPMIRIVSKGDIGQSAPMKMNPQNWNNLKASNALESLVGAADFMRNRNAGIEGSGSKLDASLPSRSLIIQVNDYNDLSRTKTGAPLLRVLRSIVDQHWRAGKNVILIGTESTSRQSEDSVDVFDITDLHAREKDADAETRLLVVPPGLPDRTAMAEEKDDAVEPLKADEDQRIRLINARHLEDMINKLSDGTPDSKFGAKVSQILIDPDTKFSTSFVSNDTVWPYSVVRKLATVMIGLEQSPEGIDASFVTQAIKILNSTYYARMAWAVQENKKYDDVPGQKQPSDTPRDKIHAIQAKCNSYEKKLLGGIQSAGELKTTFEDVHAPGETIETLKTLTSLSLQRPEAFSYGVLADNKIPGVLLYGPPGTGKTMLAKAVAKDGGATVLEVSGASVNDMYVGESEKNVRAIFTLAKKLSPCIVFIDEADALLGARSSGAAKRSGVHREIINQFLREWDGMSEQAAIIMVATNRPYDLDEAVLRRLPRRILVDLPLAHDRERILHKHISGKELLADDITPAAIAHRTPFYSGSDLKNVVVAAALECLREENAQAAAHAGSEPFDFPAKRVLHKRHFDKALDEISASISDDMATLKMIRQFDEKYGDRRGRKKKTAAMGFGGTTVEEEDAEAVLVRATKGKGKGRREGGESTEKEIEKEMA